MNTKNPTVTIGEWTISLEAEGLHIEYPAGTEVEADDSFDRKTGRVTLGWLVRAIEPTDAELEQMGASPSAPSRRRRSRATR